MHVKGSLQSDGLAAFGINPKPYLSPLYYFFYSLSLSFIRPSCDPAASRTAQSCALLYCWTPCRASLSSHFPGLCSFYFTVFGIAISSGYPVLLNEKRSQEHILMLSLRNLEAKPDNSHDTFKN
ncbi:hypothetical protein O6H91_09G103100 [Diphasiastrum complanatum]|uniref:Uncharacterized protein n=1 Tax=Diphasiastrum complanatum TaxID=34168 RepID=A0ACC2CSQ1_DIPCM|nr:hypothetical protein O6H91_09G103100 [Diphasiastrum complanatum]